MICKTANSTTLIRAYRIPFVMSVCLATIGVCVLGCDGFDCRTFFIFNSLSGGKDNEKNSIPDPRIDTYLRSSRGVRCNSFAGGNNNDRKRIGIMTCRNGECSIAVLTKNQAYALIEEFEDICDMYLE